MIWPFKKKRWGGKVRVLKKTTGTMPSFEVQEKRFDRHGSFWTTVGFSYDEKEAMEDATGLWEEKTSKKRVIAE